MDLASFVDHVYVINLDKRPDRWANVQKELASIDLLNKTTRVPAILMKGDQGCYQSHMKAIKTAISDSSKTPLILEDDVVFYDGCKPTLESAIDALPSDWDIFCVGYNFEPSWNTKFAPDFISKNLLKIRYSWTTHAYALKGTKLKDLVNRLERLRNTQPVDEAYNSISSNPPQYVRYGPYPVVTGQLAGRSDICGGGFTNYPIQKNVNDFLRRAGRIPS